MASLRAAGLTHRGAVRASNEDSIAIDGWIAPRTMTAPVQFEIELDGAALCLVADGMGGHAAGEVASGLAVRDLVEKSRDIRNAGELEAALIELNEALFDAMKADRALSGMGTTVAGVILRDRQAIVFNVGDSRVYVGRAQDLRLFSTDDSPAARRVDSRERTGQLSHTLTQCLGGWTIGTMSPHVLTLALRENTRFLLCSDGLTDMLDQDAIEACLRDDGAATVNNLFAAAMSSGGADNISVIVADYRPSDQETPDF